MPENDDQMNSRDILRSRDRATFEIHLEAVIEHIVDTLGGPDQVCNGWGRA